jgi:hypothetical protein
MTVTVFGLVIMRRGGYSEAITQACEVGRLMGRLEERHGAAFAPGDALPSANITAFELGREAERRARGATNPKRTLQGARRARRQHLHLVNSANRPDAG